MNTVALRALLPAVLLLTLQGSALAQSTWTGTSNTTWSGAGNWSPSGAPGLNADVVVDRNSAALYTISLDTSPVLTNWSSNITGAAIYNNHAQGPWGKPSFVHQWQLGENRLNRSCLSEQWSNHAIHVSRSG